LEIPHIGIVENMSSLLCPHCRKEIGLFGKDGGQELAQEMNVQFLGSIPLDIDACTLGDTGKPIVLEKPNCDVTNAFKSIVAVIVAQYQSNE
jgi:ATP-binding protein involved in chromosome partitioning